MIAVHAYVPYAGNSTVVAGPSPGSVCIFTRGPPDYSPGKVKTYNLKLPSVDLINKTYLNV